MTRSPLESFPPPPSFFHTRLSDHRPPEPRGSRRVVSADRRGAMNAGGRNMSQVSRQALFKGILGASAVVLTSGAVQFASGRDLGSLSQIPASQVALISAASGIDRTAKGDRAGSMSVS